VARFRPSRRARTAATWTTRSWSQAPRSILPIHLDGALFSCGDGHGAQGDGEVCITAIETGLIGTFELIVRDDMKLEWPMAETPTHVMTMAFDPDLDDCVVIALRDMIKLICARTGISREDAYTLCSLAADLR
jgi:acetamidase/formamidase